MNFSSSYFFIFMKVIIYEARYPTYIPQKIQNGISNGFGVVDEKVLQHTQYMSENAQCLCKITTSQYMYSNVALFIKTLMQHYVNVTSSVSQSVSAN